MGYSSDPFAGNAGDGRRWIFGMPLYGYTADLHESEFSSDVPDMLLFSLTDAEPPVNDDPPIFVPTRITLPDTPAIPITPTIPAIRVIRASRTSTVDPGDPVDPNLPALENPVVPAPEPATLLLVGGGLATMAARRRRQRWAPPDRAAFVIVDSKWRTAAHEDRKNIGIF